MQDQAAAPALGTIIEQRNALAHGRQSLPLGEIKKLVMKGIGLESWEHIPEIDGELQLVDWQPWIGSTGHKPVALFEHVAAPVHDGPFEQADLTSSGLSKTDAACTPTDPPACPAWGWDRIDPGPARIAVNASRESRLRRSLFTAKFGVVVHNLAHQLLDPGG